MDVVAHEIEGWFADRAIFEMDIRDYSPAPTARRFEAGTPPIPPTYAGIAGIELMEEGVVTSSRDGNLRVSAHCYNTAEDVETVLELLSRHRELLA